MVPRKISPSNKTEQTHIVFLGATSGQHSKNCLDFPTLGGMKFYLCSQYSVYTIHQSICQYKIICKANIFFLN